MPPGQDFDSVERSLNKVATVLEFFVYDQLLQLFERRRRRQPTVPMQIPLIRTTVVLVSYDADLINSVSRHGVTAVRGQAVRLDTSSGSKDVVLEKAGVGRQVTRVCETSRCAARVVVSTTESVRWKVINLAVAQLRRRQGFNSVFVTVRKRYVVKRVRGGRTWTVDIPYRRRFNQGGASGADA